MDSNKYEVVTQRVRFSFLAVSVLLVQIHVGKESFTRATLIDV